MSRRQDAATATVGAGLTAGGGYLRHTGVQHVLAADRLAGKTKDAKVHGWAIARRGAPVARKFYGAGAAIGLIGAPALAIGGTKFVRGDKVTKRDKSFLQEGITGTGQALLERKDTLTQKVPGKARAAGYATTTGAGALGVLAARLALKGKRGSVKAIASPVAGVLAGAAATPLSSRAVHRVSPGYEVTASGVRRKKQALKKPSSASYRHMNTPRSLQADIYKAFTPQQLRLAEGVWAGGHQMPEHVRHFARTGVWKGKPEHLEHAKVILEALKESQRVDRTLYRGVVADKDATTRVGRRRLDQLRPGREMRIGPSSFTSHEDRAATHFASALDDVRRPGHNSRVSNIVYHVRPGARAHQLGYDRGESEYIARGAFGIRGIRPHTTYKDSKVMGPYSYTQHHVDLEYIGKSADTRKYRAKVTAAGSIPLANYALQPLAAGHGIKSTSHRRRAEGNQALATVGGDVIGGLAGMHGAAKLAEHSDHFRVKAQQASDGIDSLRSKVGLKPKVLKPAGTSGGRAGAAVRAATRPLRGKYGVAAGIGTLAGTMVVGNAAQQSAISHNIKRHVGKAAAPAPGMTRTEQNKQMKRKARLIAVNTLGATTGAAGLGTFTASRMQHFAAHKPRLEAATLGLGAIGGGIGSYGGFKRAKVERRDLRAQRRSLGVAKGMPDQSALTVPTGLLKTKAYTASSVRTTTTGKLVRTKAGVR